ncbi:MAG: hypothetical protein LQ352_005812 [Teloschistes flavicans]|nr:MAG: hypothetical protein LQ352_005812 [Teloschistes flavicans]
MTTPQAHQPATADHGKFVTEESGDPFWQCKSMKSDELLDFYYIFLQRDMPMPNDLISLIHAVAIRRPGDLTPLSKLVKNNWNISRTLPELNAQIALENALGYSGETENYNLGVKSEWAVYRDHNRLWNATCLPIPTDAQNKLVQPIFHKAGLPKTPKPDIAYGYTATVFEPNIQQMLLTLPNGANPVHGPPYFPYWVVQWKSTYSGGTIHEATTQARRDGSAAVFAMHNLYVALGVENPSPATTAIYTTCIDSDQFVTRVHWRYVDPETRRVSYEADLVNHGLISKADDVFLFRSIIFNMLDWAREVRLPAIKKALVQGGARMISQVQMPSPMKRKADSQQKRDKRYLTQQLKFDCSADPIV